MQRWKHSRQSMKKTKRSFWMWEMGLTKRARNVICNTGIQTRTNHNPLRANAIQARSHKKEMFSVSELSKAIAVLLLAAITGAQASNTAYKAREIRKSPVWINATPLTLK